MILVEEGGGGGRGRGLEAEGKRSDGRSSDVGSSERGDGVRETGWIRISTTCDIGCPMMFQQLKDFRRRGRRSWMLRVSSTRSHPSDDNLREPFPPAFNFSNGMDDAMGANRGDWCQRSPLLPVRRCW